MLNYKKQRKTQGDREILWHDEITKTTFSRYCELFDNLNFEIRQGEYVLDLGCGRGKALVPDRKNKSLIQAVGISGRVVGVDLDSRNIIKAAENISNYLKSNNLLEYYALFVLSNAEELRQSKKFLEHAVDQQLLEKNGANSWGHLLNDRKAACENIKELEKNIGKRLIILYHTDAHIMDLCPQNYFNRITECHVLMHAANPFEVVKKCALVLKRRGTAYFTDFDVLGKNNRPLRGSSFLDSIKGINVTKKSHYEWTFSMEKKGDDKQIIGSEWPKLDCHRKICS